MAKKEVLIAVGLVVLSLAIGIMIGKMRGGSGERDLNASSAEYQNKGGGEAQPAANQPPSDDYETQIQKILKERPDNAGAYAEVGDIYFDQRKFNDAIVYYKKAIALDQNDIDSYNDLGLAYHYIDRSDEGLKYVEEGIKRSPLYQRIWLTKGFILAVRGNIAEARIAWEKVYNMDPNSEIGKSAASFLAQYKEAPAK